MGFASMPEAASFRKNMRKILLRNTMLNGAETDVLIAGIRFEKIAPGQIAENGTEIVDAAGTAILPPFYNARKKQAFPQRALTCFGHFEGFDFFEFFAGETMAINGFCNRVLCIAKLIRNFFQKFAEAQKFRFNRNERFSNFR